jgi:glyoxylase-like metal-dependent hydrolase (beta-lactamase superfamily II)
MRVAEGVEQIVNEGVVNWFLVETGDGLIAVDAGFPSAWNQIRDRASELKAILLTHCHIDHLGFSSKAQREHGTPVHLPERDRELAQHPLRYAKSERLPLLYLRYPATLSLYLKGTKAGAPLAKTVENPTTYGDGAELPGGFRAVFTPGHTKGHMALHLPDRDILFAGDALVTRDPYTGRTGPRLVARAATWDSEINLQSLDRIARTGAGTVVCGHGDPWTDGAESAAAAARAAGAA